MMRISITLWLAEGGCTLFEGEPEECPPIPRPGDVVQYDNVRPARIEGVQHVYREAGVEIQLLA